MNTSPVFPLTIAVEPRSASDRERLMSALAELAEQDQSFDYSIHQESGQTILKSMGELHLDVIVDRLKRAYKIDMNVGAPQVAYRETMNRSVTKDYTHKKISSDTAQFARISLSAGPNERGSGSMFVLNLSEDVIPARFMHGIKKGLESATSAGVLGGFPVVNIRVEVLSGAYHETDSSADAFEIAARAALREALAEASVLLEPVMKVEVSAPWDCIERVIGDLRSRRGEIVSRDARGETVAVTALVPLATMFGYVNVLRSASGGRATYTMEFDRYAEVPRSDDDPFRPAAAMRA